MKAKWKSILTITTIIILAITIINLIANVYPETAVITDIQSETVTVTCANGNEFQFEDEDGDWFYGDIVSMKMYSNGTEIVTDDIILDVRYGGFIRLFDEIL